MAHPAGGIDHAMSLPARELSKVVERGAAGLRGARCSVAALRPVRNQRTSSPRPTRQAATAAPMPTRMKNSKHTRWEHVRSVRRCAGGGKPAAR